MVFKRNKCGWTPTESSYYSTREDIAEIINHPKVCPKK